MPYYIRLSFNNTENQAGTYNLDVFYSNAVYFKGK